MMQESYMSVLVTYKGVALKHGNAYMHRQVGSPEPEPIVLPPQTIRFRFENSEYDPTIIENGGVWTKVTGSSFNDWDWYCEDTNWDCKFTYKFIGENKTSIIATGDMSNVATVDGMMFAYCSGLTSISENAFPNLTDANYMFGGCTGLTSIPTNSFHNVAVAKSMFRDCLGLTSIPVNAFPNVTDAKKMFYNCPNVQSGALGLYNNWLTGGKVTNHDSTFTDCGKNTESGQTELQQIPESWGGLKEDEPVIELPANTIRFRFENADYDPTVIENGGIWTKVAGSSYNDWDWYCEDTDWESKFNNDNGWAFTEDNRTSIIATGDMSNVTSGTFCMFDGCTGLTSIPENAFPNLTNADNYMFYGCTGLTSIPENAFPNLTNAGKYMFGGCTGLTSIPENLFPNLTGGTGMFDGCTGLTSIPENLFPNLTDGSYMFSGCTGLTSIPENLFPNLTNGSYMFYGCTGLTSIPENLFPNLTNGGAMFRDCTGLTSIPENLFPKLTNGYNMFCGCTNVQNGALGLYRNLLAGGTVTSHSGTFYQCGSNTETGRAELNQIPKSWGGLAS